MNEEFLICSGCGVPIQTTDPAISGYAPPAALKRKAVTCQRCYRLTHYNEIPDVPLQNEDFIEMLKSIGRTNSLVVMIVDLFDVEGSWLLEKEYLQNNNVLLVGNKLDLLPGSVNERKIKTWLKKEALQKGWKPVDVMLMSAAKRPADVAAIAARIDEERGGQDVYIVGCTNVGKSTFINQIIKLFDGDEDQLITTSIFPGTTLAFIDLPLEDGKKLYDTPGVINPQQMLHLMPKEELHHLLPKKEIKPTVFQLSNEQTLFFGGLARMDFVSGPDNHFVCYFPAAFKPHRTKLSAADELYDRHAGEELLFPPSKQALEQLPVLKKRRFTIENKKTDLVIPGLGWITVGNAGAIVDVHTPEGTYVTTREAII